MRYWVEHARADPTNGKTGLTTAAPNRRWVGDTTEFVIGESGKLYLAAILDLFSHFVVGWAVSAVNDRHLTAKALRHPTPTLRQRVPITREPSEGAACE